MKLEDLYALTRHRLDKAEESLKAAKMVLDNGMPIFSMNRVYYCLFYSIQALLALQGVSFSKHGQLKSYFNREFIKTGSEPKKTRLPLLTATRLFLSFLFLRTQNRIKCDHAMM